MPKITLAQANRIIEATLAQAREMDLKPMTVAVLDDGGHMVAFQREDNSAILRFEVAFGKAWGALGMGRSTRALREVAQDRPHFMESLTIASMGRMIPVLGGLLIRDREGNLLGAIGVTGDAEEKDEIIALAGVEAAGLVGEV